VKNIRSCLWWQKELQPRKTPNSRKKTEPVLCFSLRPLRLCEIPGFSLFDLAEVPKTEKSVAHRKALDSR
jgi:hypothetical protein